MKNFALYFAGLIFTLVSIIHIIRYSLAWTITIQHFHIPVSWSIYGANITALLAIWMFLSAIKKK